ncbi:MAG: YafY family transcriptional regulator [Ectothiorhodospiraceae bacterium]|nr:YafY family transcriptional regulator [Ectothiorhodospiraceae bacterium]
MRRADRLFQIVQYLRSRRLTKAAWLAERLQVSVRTIYRDIQDLSLSGVPVEGEAGVGYILRQPMHLPPLMFDRSEIEALVVGARMVKSYADPELQRAADSVLAKVHGILPASLRSELNSNRMYAPSFHRYPVHWLTDIREAIRHRKKLLLWYCSEDERETQRQVRPLGLFFWGQVWTLSAWCELRDDFRTFRVDRVQQLQHLDECFEHEDGKRLEELLAKYVPADFLQPEFNV